LSLRQDEAGVLAESAHLQMQHYHPAHLASGTSSFMAQASCWLLMLQSS